MKCDELKAYGMNDPAIGDEYEMYKVSDVDAAIDELKEKIDGQKWRGYEWARAANDKEKQIVELKDENRKLKRALWLARAERAVAEQTVDEWSRYKEKHPFGSWREDPFEYWVQAWIYVEKLFRKKAKEYK